MRQRAQFQISSPQDLPTIMIMVIWRYPPNATTHPQTKMRPWTKGLLRDYSGLHNHSHLRSDSPFFEGKNLTFSFLSEVLPSDDPNPLKSIGYHSNRKKNIQNPHLSLVENDDQLLGPPRNRCCWLTHKIYLHMAMSLPVKPISSSPWRSKPWAHQEKMQKDSQINFTDLLAMGFFWLVFFSTVPFFGLQVICNSNPNRSFIFFGCICLLNRIPNLPSLTGFHRNSSIHRSTNDHTKRREKDMAPFTRRCQKCGKETYPTTSTSIFRQGPFYNTHPNTLSYFFFEKSPQNCHTFAIKFDDPPKQKISK